MRVAAALGQLDGSCVHVHQPVKQRIDVAVRVSASNLELSAHDRQQGAQFVRGIRRELLLFGHVGLESVEHHVEDIRQVAELIGPALQRGALRQVTCAAGRATSLMRPSGASIRPAMNHPQMKPIARSKTMIPIDEQRLVDRFVTDPHGLIIREINRLSVSDLLRTPRRRPPLILPMRLVPPLPRLGLRPEDNGPIRASHRPVEAFLDVLAKPVVGDQFRNFRASGRLLRLPLRDARPVLQCPATRCGVATQLA